METSETEPTRLDAIFCDDIRQEANGKYFLIGTYPDDLSVMTFPAAFPLSMWVRMYGLPAGHHHIRLRLLVNQAEHLVLNTEIDVPEGTRKIQAFLGPMQIMIDRPGEIAIAAAFVEGPEIGQAVLGVTPQQGQTP